MGKATPAAAASNALPPSFGMAMAVAEASRWVEATTPQVPRISGRVVNALMVTCLDGRSELERAPCRWPRGFCRTSPARGIDSGKRGR